MQFPVHFNKPLLIKSNCDYVTEVESHLKEYAALFKKAIGYYIKKKLISSSERQLIADTTYRVELIIQILEGFNSGHRFEAFDQFKELMDSYQRVFSNQFFFSKIFPGDHFYRFRTDDGVDKDRKDRKVAKKYILFHIPFRLRRKANNLRFNGQGLPCLYCANNLKTAWVESKSPGKTSLTDDNKKAKRFFNVAIFKNAGEINSIDLSLKDFNVLHALALSNPYKLTQFLDYLLLYPLIIASHTKIQYSKNDWVGFNNEYVFPTLFMDWFLSNGGDAIFKTFSSVRCIKYSSVEDGSPFTSHNYVFPANYKKGSDYSDDLTKVFLNPKGFYYLYQDGLPKGIKKIDRSSLAMVNKLLVTHC